jgi:hypothetical protein
MNMNDHVLGLLGLLGFTVAYIYELCVSRRQRRGQQSEKVKN